MAKMRMGRKANGDGDESKKSSGSAKSPVQPGVKYEGLRGMGPGGKRVTPTAMDSVAYRQGYTRGVLGEKPKAVSAKSKVLSTDYNREAGVSEGMRARMARLKNK